MPARRRTRVAFASYFPLFPRQCPLAHIASFIFLPFSHFLFGALLFTSISLLFFSPNSPLFFPSISPLFYTSISSFLFPSTSPSFVPSMSALFPPLPHSSSPPSLPPSIQRFFSLISPLSPPCHSLSPSYSTSPFRARRTPMGQAGSPSKGNKNGARGRPL